MSEKRPFWLLAELTYRCPLRCSYCSNPIDYEDTFKNELTTESWIRVLKEARQLGAVQLGLSGGEPLLRRDLEQIVTEARNLGYYSNLITSGIGLGRERLTALKNAGLDHIQISFQAHEAILNEKIGGLDSFRKKVAAAKLVKEFELPMVINFVLHRKNIEYTSQMIQLAADLGANYVELASAQFDGWALKFRDTLMPSLKAVRDAEKIAKQMQLEFAGRMKIIFVVPDYYEDRPKPCSAGWGNLFMNVSPDGMVLPCHGARKMPFEIFPNVNQHSLAQIWTNSVVFNAFRGESWMPETCKACPERTKDFGGCRCQAFALTGDLKATDPACSKAPDHYKVLNARKLAEDEFVARHWPVYRGIQHS